MPFAGCWGGGWDMTSEQTEAEKRRSERSRVKAELQRRQWARVV